MSEQRPSAHGAILDAELAGGREIARSIANAWLDGRMNSLTQCVPDDPDCEAFVLARQYLRLLETAEKMVLKPYGDVVMAARSLADQIRPRSPGSSTDLEDKLIAAVDALYAATWGG